MNFMRYGTVALMILVINFANAPVLNAIELNECNEPVPNAIELNECDKPVPNAIELNECDEPVSNTIQLNECDEPDLKDPSCEFDVAAESQYDTPYAASTLLPSLLMSLASQKHTPDTKNQLRDSYDYIVVGGGSAGSVVASRLSEISCVSVLVVEAGRPSPILMELPNLYAHIYNEDLDWEFETVPQRYTAALMEDRKVPMSAAKTLGGGSTHNAMIYTRGNRRNYDEWAALGATGWSYQDVLPYFLKLENNTDPNLLKNGYHAVGGPITVSSSTYNSEKKLASFKALRNRGYKPVDPNGFEQTGVFDVQTNMKEGQRCGTAKAYLVPAEKRANLDIVAEAMVRKVIIKNKKAVGIELDYKNKTITVLANKEVILSAGSVNSAKLLLLSGIGPMSELKNHKIPLIADLPVGLNFQDHFLVILTYEVNSDVPTYHNHVRDEKKVEEYIKYKTGPLTNSGGILFLSFLSKSNPTTNLIPDYLLYLHDSDEPLLPPGYKQEKNASYISCYPLVIHPHSKGTVSLKSADPYDPPLIDPNYLADPLDVHDAVEGLKECNRIMEDPAMKAIGAKPLNYVLDECKEFAGNEDLYLKCYVTLFIQSASHPVGTARMGDPEDPRTVVDPTLRVKGIDGLRVVDASVMPKIPWACMNIPTIMVAEKASDIIKQSITCNAKA